ncbi:MAG: GGDEF domain-containing protein [Pseudomonas sp.]|jgi:diguanylate cyclase (GGDEF)-like protein
MSQISKPPSLIDLYPEETREAAELLKHAVPLMMRHDIPPNPVHYALWYTYSRGSEPELNRRMDKAVEDFDVFPPETACRLFRDYIIRGELEEARAGQQQVIELVDDIEGDVSRSVIGSQHYQQSLTRVFNRHAFARLLERALNESHQGLALVILDIDHFKQLNDQYGHPLGDRVLQHVGQLLRDLLPPDAFAARYGGEEFCVVLRNCNDLNEALDFAEQLRNKIQALRVKVRRTDQILDSITASFGCTVAEEGDTFESLLTRADDALYQAKRAGRNQVHPIASEKMLTA